MLFYFVGCFFFLFWFLNKNRLLRKKQIVRRHISNMFLVFFLSHLTTKLKDYIIFEKTIRRLLKTKSTLENTAWTTVKCFHIMYDRWSQNSTCLLEIEVSPVGQRIIWINNKIKNKNKKPHKWIRTGHKCNET